MITKRLASSTKSSDRGDIVVVAVVVIVTLE